MDYKKGLDPVNGCEKMTTEIMATGLSIFGLCMIVLVSSFFRAYLKFEVFIGLHYLVLVIFILTILHTLDREFRDQSAVGVARSQTWPWFSWSFAIYLGDKLWGFCRMRRCVISDFLVCTDQKTVVMSVLRPWDFHFSPGQYAMLQVPAIDHRWHPFSIGSDPNSDRLSFYIEVCLLAVLRPTRTFSWCALQNFSFVNRAYRHFWKRVSVCISVHRCASVCISVHQCASVCISVYQCASVCISVHQCA